MSATDGRWWEAPSWIPYNGWCRRLIDGVILTVMLVSFFAACLFLLRFAFRFITS